MRFSLLPLAAGLLPLASAYITGLAPHIGVYHPDELTSMFPVTFRTGSTKVPFFDLSVSFGLTTPAEHTASTTFGNALVNIDLAALKRADTGPGQFTISVPINTGDLYNGPGAYVLTAAVVRITGDPGVSQFRADPFFVPFNATF
ncbi:hypothetical protein AURDEDRAFT_188043 [Auricularia subglabra TFB-10046 SS5]|uniref:Uncharacterized protein n=1 Tax=Auricularia subglabra (strain TFB-10046 / SS5) TaxID=717982 RepID=J0CZX4_AURST|nr:hypothetical protein AURDEDRAFT_188043 [Auricularia subglabra TFB-10046 SS5]